MKFCINIEDTSENRVFIFSALLLIIGFILGINSAVIE